MILEYEGYEVLTAATGEDGIAQAEREAPDLVFLDVKMPGMDGLEVLQRLRHLVEVTPIVVISGHGTVSTAVEATKLGAFDFIEKPLETRARAGHGAQRRRFAAAADREPVVPARRREALSDRRRLAAPGARARVDCQGGADQCHGADLGRERRRQGAGGAGDPPREPAPRRPVRAGQLRRHSRRADRVGAVRPRERARSPAPPIARSASSSRPTRARSSSTKSAT